MRSIDWSQTPLGPVETWPQSLKTALSILLAQRTAVFIFWGPEHVQFYNDTYRPILGTKKHPAAMGQRGCDCWQEIWDIILPMLKAVYRGESTAVEDGLLVIDRNGYLEEGYYTYTYSPIVDESGKVGGAFCVVYDTTERVIGERRLRTLRDLASRGSTAKTAEDACRAAAETLAANPQDIPFAAIYLFDPGGEQAHLVASVGVEAGAAVSPLVIAKDTQSPVAAAALTGRIEVIENLAELLGPLPGGSWPVGAESGIVIPMTPPGHSQPAGFLVSGISPRKRLDASYRTFFDLVNGQIATAVAEARAYEEERKRAEALAELDRAKTVFFSNVSHEFRTPLTLMLGPVEDLLARPDELPAGARQELELIHRNGLRLLKLVNTLLEFARIEAGRVHAAYEPLDLATVTADLASVFRSAIEKAGLRLIIDCPPLSDPVFVDRDMWEKIVLNLLSNALKFTFEGEIAISLRRSGSAAELSIRDTGIGIPADDLPHIFERFHRVEGARGRTMEGSGIGLALVQELVRLHGGQIRVESETGRGSVFTVSVPLGSEHLPSGRIADAARTPSPVGARPYVEEALRWLPDTPHQPAEILELPSIRAAQRTAPPEHATRAGRILVADDNADMREYIRRLLAETYEVETVSDGLAAAAALRNGTFDLVLADVMMPGLDGFGLLRELRRDERNRLMPVVLLSARAGEEARIEGLQAGADDYLVKPFGARELQARVSSRIEIARLRRDAMERERELRLLTDAERERWRDLLLLAPAVIAVLRGPEHVFDLVNPPYVRAVGRADAASLLGKPIREALPEIEGQGLIELLDDVYRSGEPYFGSERLVKLDMRGDAVLEDRYFNFVYQPSRNILGQVEGILVHAMDVTDQVLARRRVEDSERQLRTMADSMPQLVWMADPDGHTFWYNRGWYEYTGTTPEQVMGWGWQCVLDPEYVPRVLDRWRSSLATGEPFEMEFPMRAANGEYRWFLTRGSPVRDASGNILRWYGTNTDIEDRKRAEEAIRQKQRLESTGLLAGGVAHDFNNLLTGVLGSASLLLDQLPAADPHAELVEGIVEAAERAAHLTRQMLAYAGKGSFIVQKLNLSDHVREITDLIHAAIPKKVAVSIETSGEVPWIEADPGQLQQIIMNLVINAAEAIGTERPGTVKIRSRVEHVAPGSGAQFIPEPPAPGSYAVLQVQDDGPGMTPDVAGRIFDPFFSTKFTGRGLGLSAVLGIVRSHRGAITVHSDLGRGSVFSVYLPAISGSQLVGGTAPQETARPNPGTVLMVDDEPIVRRTVRQMLEHFGYTVLTAANGREGVELFRQKLAEIDAVLLDLTMPVMDGVEALRHMQAIAPKIPVILSSGYDESEATRRFSGRGLAGFIQKPYAASKLLALLGRVMGTRHASGGKGELLPQY